MSDPDPVGSVATQSDKNEFVYVGYESQSEEIVTYVDETDGLTIGAPAGNSTFSQGDTTSNTDISNFLHRPVKIDTFSWLESDVQGVKRTISPWSLWATNPAVTAKLQNYAFMRGDLHLKIVVNASPFYYGMLQATYLPLPVFKPSTIVNDAGLRYLIPYSQRPRLVVDPQHQEAGELILPFIYNYNMITNGLASAYAALGQLDFIIYAPLQSANGVAGSGITITTYAWMDNIVLSGATCQYAAQSDEYGEGCVSKPASTVARAASYFERIPFIGPFATATRIGASAISSIASLFGFTNVPVILDTVPQRPEAFPKMASTELGFPIEKLTFDPKNELSIDPRIIGLPDGSDEMMLCSLMQRESFLTSCTWATSNNVDDIMFYSRVNPNLLDVDAATNAKVYFTPMAYFSRLFKNWRGDIIFKFKIVASKYHKGRLRISYDPAGTATQNIGLVPDTTNLVQTVIIDIGEVNEVEFRVPYQQAAQFLSTRNDINVGNKGWAPNAVPPTFPYDPTYDNGFITVRVLNILSAPVASSNVSILVYVRAAPTLEVANPQSIDTTHRLSCYAPQSEYLREETTELTDNLGGVSLAADNQYQVHFGENVRSLRQVLRRYAYHSTSWINVPPSPTGDTLAICTKRFYKPPTSPGYLANGTEVANSIIAGSPSPYNYCQYTTLAYVMNSFLAYRGSINWSFNPIVSGSAVSEVRVSRDNLFGGVAGYKSVSVTGSANVFAKTMLDARTDGEAGQAVTNGFVNPGMNVQCPMYTASKFQSTAPVNANLGVAMDGSINDCFVLEVLFKNNVGATATPILVNSYVGVGTDFSLHFFMNVPTLYVYSVVPTPV